MIDEKKLIKDSVDLLLNFMKEFDYVWRTRNEITVGKFNDYRTELLEKGYRINISHISGVYKIQIHRIRPGRRSNKLIYENLLTMDDVKIYNRSKNIDKLLE